MLGGDIDQSRDTPFVREPSIGIVPASVGDSFDGPGRKPPRAHVPIRIVRGVCGLAPGIAWFAHAYIRPVIRAPSKAAVATTLDLSRPGVPELLSDFECLALWEALQSLGRSGGGIASNELVRVTGLPAAEVDSSLALLESLGLVRRGPSAPGAPVTFVAEQGPLVVTFDPADRATSLRLASARLNLWSHVQRLSQPSASTDAARRWRRATIGEVPLDSLQRAELAACIDRIDACLEKAEEASGASTVGAPRYRVQVSVDTFPPRPLAMPLVLLMQPSEAEARITRRATGGRPSGLSVREMEVAQRLSAGRTKREIADQLGIKFSTVNTLSARVYRKLGISRRAELANLMRDT